MPRHLIGYFFRSLYPCLFKLVPGCNTGGTAMADPHQAQRGGPNHMAGPSICYLHSYWLMSLCQALLLAIFSGVFILAFLNLFLDATLVALPWLIPTRLHVEGWSFYLLSSLLLAHELMTSPHIGYFFQESLSSPY
jgi:hypothetical protein